MFLKEYEDNNSHGDYTTSCLYERSSSGIKRIRIPFNEFKNYYPFIGYGQMEGDTLFGIYIKEDKLYLIIENEDYLIQPSDNVSIGIISSWQNKLLKVGESFLEIKKNGISLCYFKYVSYLIGDPTIDSEVMEDSFYTYLQRFFYNKKTVTDLKDFFNDLNIYYKKR